MKSNESFTERGQVLVLVAIAAIVLFGFAALAIDGSAKLSDRRHAQNAADTAANAAALAKVNALLDATKSQAPTTCPAVTTPYSDVCTLLLQAGKDRAASNGYNNDITNNTVEVYSPPVSGYYSTVANKDKYVQVIITSKVKTTFGRILGLSETVNVVQAVALAEPGGSIAKGASIVSLNPSPNCSSGSGSGGGSVDIGGNGTINLTGGGVFVNSSAACGYSQTSCSVTINISSGGISSAGSAINLNGCSGSGLTTNTTQKQIVVPDEVYMPDKPTECSTTPAAPSKIGSTWYLNPGYYATFPPSTLGSNKTLAMNAGIYCVNDISWSGSDFAQLTGDNVTFYIPKGNGGFSINIGKAININAPDTGDYKGYLFIVDGSQSNIDSCKINGSSDIFMTGTIFAPYCDVEIKGGNTSTSFSAQVIGYNVKITGASTLIFNYNPGDNAKIKRKIGLMK